jgi:hypothetical protein
MTNPQQVDIEKLNLLIQIDVDAADFPIRESVSSTETRRSP